MLVSTKMIIMFAMVMSSLRCICFADVAEEDSLKRWKIDRSCYPATL